MRLYIDVPAAEAKARGVGIEECEAVSRRVSAQLSTSRILISGTTPEVSSPGLDRPLFGAAQFARFAGQHRQGHLKLPQDGRHRFQGKTAWRWGWPGHRFARSRRSRENRDDAAGISTRPGWCLDWVALGLRAGNGQAVGRIAPAAA